MLQNYDCGISLIFAITVVEYNIRFVFNILTPKLTVKGILVANEIRFDKKKKIGVRLVHENGMGEESKSIMVLLLYRNISHPLNDDNQYRVLGTK